MRRAGSCPACWWRDGGAARPPGCRSVHPGGGFTISLCAIKSHVDTFQTVLVTQDGNITQQKNKEHFSSGQVETLRSITSRLQRTSWLFVQSSYLIWCWHMWHDDPACLEPWRKERKCFKELTCRPGSCGSACRSSRMNWEDGDLHDAAPPPRSGRQRPRWSCRWNNSSL